MTRAVADVVWMNGKLVPFGDARVHITTHALHYGIGVFEGIRFYAHTDGRSAIFRLRDHLDRLYDSAKICGLSIPFRRDQVTAGCEAAIRGNELAEGYLRPIAFLGEGHLGVGSLDPEVDVAILAIPWGSSLGEKSGRDGIRARVSSFVRDGVNSAMTKAKICGQYVGSTLAKREAVASGVDEAILLDASGCVAEASAENIFIVWRDRLMTPPLSLPILAGITRASVIHLARRQGIDACEETFTRDMLYTADEVFLTGTAAEIVPVREIDGRPIGNGEPGGLTASLQEAFHKLTRGPASPEPSWLHFL